MTEKEKSRLNSWINRLPINEALPSDTDGQRLRKSVLLLLVIIYTILGVLWGVGYMALGLPLAGSFPLGYSIISAVSLAYFFRSKRYKFFCRSQLALILILPFLLQLSLGGFAASGAVILWAILSPIGALMFAGTTRALPWFLAYVLLLVVSNLISGTPPKSSLLSPVVVVSSFVMNISAVSAIVFFLLKFFVQAREKAMADLDNEHRKVRQSLDLAMEVQQNLLPKFDPQVAGLDISGISIYCDETGGDYYDFLGFGNPEDGKIGLVVGDVSDHGIPSALLMATVRALIRQRCSSFGHIEQVVVDVNRHLVEDVKDSGRFMTLFYMEIERQKDVIRWVNAGHDPAILYNPLEDAFEELDGNSNLALGVIKDTKYSESKRDIAPGQVIVIATDGIWEVINQDEEMFGKDRLYKTIRQNSSGTAKDIQSAILKSVESFRREVKLEDDMTIVVVKIEQDRK
jgi:serine phosphatase RsbU (regulator of sigma subunit)